MTHMNTSTQRELLEEIATELISSNGPEYGADVADIYMRLISLGQSFDHQNPNSEMVRELEEIADNLDHILGQDGEYGETLTTASDKLRSLAEDERLALSYAPQMAAIRGLLDEGEELVHEVATDLVSVFDLLDEQTDQPCLMGDFNHGDEASKGPFRVGPIVILTANSGKPQLPPQLEKRMREPLIIKRTPTDHGPTILPMQVENGE